jgi:hypothetical protein
LAGVRVGDPAVEGSLGYVSPERLAGRPSDPRDDIFGFGRILEDVLDAIAERANPEADAHLLQRWRPLALACVGPYESRPADARALVTRIRVESA